MNSSSITLLLLRTYHELLNRVYLAKNISFRRKRVSMGKSSFTIEIFTKSRACTITCQFFVVAAAFFLSFFSSPGCIVDYYLDPLHLQVILDRLCMLLESFLLFSELVN